MVIPLSGHSGPAVSVTDEAVGLCVSQSHVLWMRETLRVAGQMGLSRRQPSAVVDVWRVGAERTFTSLP
jgi:hypothetical protein